MIQQKTTYIKLASIGLNELHQTAFSRYAEYTFQSYNIINIIDNIHITLGTTFKY